MKDEQTTEKEYLLTLEGQRDHRKDGAGTNDTNPLYCGSYTIENYTRDRDSGVMKPETVEFERFLISGLEQRDPGEWERYERLYNEALKAYNGPTEWEHGYNMSIAPCDRPSCWKYYLSYYELTDAQAIEVIREQLEHSGELASFADRVHPALLEVMEGSDWLQVTEDWERMKAILRPEYIPQIPTADEFAHLILIMNSGWYLEGYIPDLEDEEEQETERVEDLFDEARVTTRAAKSILEYELRFMRDNLEAGKEKLTAQNVTNERLKELEAEGYGPLIEYVRANYTEDRARRFRISDLGIYTLYVLIEYKALAGSPPETITADTEALLEQVYQRIEGNANRYVTVILEGQGESDESDTGDISDLPLACGIRKVNLENYTDESSRSALVHDHVARDLTAQGTEGKGWGNFNEIKGYGNEKLRVKMYNQDGTVRPATQRLRLGIRLCYQIGLYLQEMKKVGDERRPITCDTLIEMLYGVTDPGQIGIERIRDMQALMSEMSEIWIRFDKKRFTGTEKDWNTYFGDAANVGIRLLNYDIEWRRTAHGQKTIAYIFNRSPPLWGIALWNHLYSVTPMLMTTPKYYFDEEEWNNLDIAPEVRKKIIDHYDKEGLKLRRKDRGLLLQPFESVYIKDWILNELALKMNMDRDVGRKHPIKWNMKETFGKINPKIETPGERTTKWIQFTVDFRMYLLYLMAWGYVEDYTYTGARSNPKIIEVRYTDKGWEIIGGVKYCKLKPQ